ncbi:MAG: DUF59 domain-containing protein [Burkholderiales bacterium]|nr:DUF59 domain-containing protein [Burkholderiales bacterium]
MNQTAPDAHPALSTSERLEENIIAALRTIFDPELPVNIYDLGLIYQLDVSSEGVVDVDMTLTTPACPVAATFPAVVETRLLEVPGVSAVHVELVWEPAWSLDRVPFDVKLELGML